jgi:hypothetical protein
LHLARQRSLSMRNHARFEVERQLLDLARRRARPELERTARTRHRRNSRHAAPGKAARWRAYWRGEHPMMRLKAVLKALSEFIAEVQRIALPGR